MPKVEIRPAGVANKINSVPGCTSGEPPGAKEGSGWSLGRREKSRTSNRRIVLHLALDCHTHSAEARALTNL